MGSGEVDTQVLERHLVSKPRVKDREMEEGCKRTREERNEVLREEWVY